MWFPSWCAVDYVLKYKSTGVELLSGSWRCDYKAADDLMQFSLSEYGYFTEPIKVEELEVSMVLCPLKPGLEEKLTIHPFIYYKEKDGDEDYLFPMEPNVEIKDGSYDAKKLEKRKGSNLGLAGVLDPYDNHQSDQVFARNGPLSNRGKTKEVLLDDVGGAAFRATSTLGGALFGGAKGKRSERDRDRDTSVRNANAKAGRSSLGNSKGDRKTKTKPKQKTAQLSTSGNGSYNKFLETTNTMHTSVAGSGESVNTNGNMKKESNMPSNSREVKESGNAANLPLNDIDPIGELGVEPDLGAPQDFNSWFNFDVDGLADHDSIGLEIPMDDLSELNMF
nr:uncharacterized protein LOC109148070 [Ipomoea trifida]